jgi:hypothetical protein
MAGVDQTSLDFTASSPTYPFLVDASQPADVQVAIQEIVNSTSEITGGECIPHVSDTWSTRLMPHICPRRCPPRRSTARWLAMPISMISRAPLPNGQGQAPVLRGPLTGALSYNFSNLTPGTYQLDRESFQYESSLCSPTACPSAAPP